MAVIAVIDNAAELAAEIEAKTGLLQAIKEGNLPSYIQTVYGVPTGTPAVEATTPAVDAGPLVAAPAQPEVPSLVVTAPAVPEVPSLVVPTALTI